MVLIVPVPGHCLPFAFRQEELVWSVLPIQMFNKYIAEVSFSMKTRVFYRVFKIIASLSS